MRQDEESLQQSLERLQTDVKWSPTGCSPHTDVVRDARLRHATRLALAGGVTGFVAGLIRSSQLGSEPDWSSWSDRGAAVLMSGGAAIAVASVIVLIIFHRRFRSARLVERSSPALPTVRGMERSRFLIGVVFFGLVVLAGLAGGVWEIGHAVSLSRYSTPVDGTVVSATCAYKNNNTVDVVYEFGGAEYRTHVAGWSHCSQIGDSAWLIVDERHPTDVSESVDGLNMDYVYGVGCLALAAGGGRMLSSLFRGRLS